MRKYVGLDVAMKETAICVIDEQGRVVAERKVASLPETIAAVVKAEGIEVERVGLETGPLAVWLWNELRALGLPAICIDARHAKAGLSMMINKTDRNDAVGLAQIMRTGWFRQVHVKSKPSHLTRALLTSRGLLVGMRGDIDNQMRGLLKTFGIVVGKAMGGFRKRVAEIVSGELAECPELARLMATLLAAREDIARRILVLDREVMKQAKASEVCRRFMTVPGIGAVTSLSVWAAIDDPGRFVRSSSVGAYLGLTPRRYASGEIDRSGRISKCGDREARTHLFEAANVLLTRITKPCALKSWGLRIAKRSGFKKAKVAVARKIAVILHRMWVDGTDFRWDPRAIAA
jgi:transposase